jgi:hypothetical protein
VQLHRGDFPAAATPWLVVVFTSATCDACRDVWARARLLARPDVHVVEVEVGEQPQLHRRYLIDAVPTTLVADAQGVVVASFLGPVRGNDLADALARAEHDAG